MDGAPESISSDDHVSDAAETIRRPSIEEPENERYAALLDLHDKHGGLTPDVVVEAARHRNSVLHDAFEWDDTLAAHQYRIGQARRLVQRFRLRVIKPPDKSFHVRAFVHEPDRGTYGSAVDVASHEDRREAVIRRLRDDYVRLAKRAENYIEFVELVAATHALSVPK